MTGGQFAELLQALGRDPDERLAIGYQSGWTLTTVAEAPTFVASRNQHFSAVPFGPAVELPHHGGESDAVGLRSLGIDLDGSRDENRAAYRLLHREFGPPAATVRSGRGIHLHWRCERRDWESDDHAAIIAAKVYSARFQYRVNQLIPAADITRDLARMWRVPGSLHIKYPKNAEGKEIRLPGTGTRLPVELIEVNANSEPIRSEPLPILPAGLAARITQIAYSDGALGSGALDGIGPCPSILDTRCA